MKKKIMALVLATVMALSVTSVAFADNGKNGNKGNHWNNGNHKNKGKIELKCNNNTTVNIQREIQKTENKIVMINKQIQHWTVLKTEIAKKIATTTTQVASGDVVRVELYTRQLADLETWHTAAIAVTGRTADQINEINKVYTAEKASLTAKLTRANTGSAHKGDNLQNALTQANKKIEQLNKDLVELNKKLVELKAKAVITPIPTVTP